MFAADALIRNVPQSYTGSSLDWFMGKSTGKQSVQIPKWISLLQIFAYTNSEILWWCYWTIPNCSKRIIINHQSMGGLLLFYQHELRCIVKMFIKLPPRKHWKTKMHNKSTPWSWWHMKTMFILQVCGCLWQRQSCRNCSRGCWISQIRRVWKGLEKLQPSFDETPCCSCGFPTLLATPHRFLSWTKWT